MSITDRLRINIALAALRCMEPAAIARWIMQEPGAAELVHRFAFLSDDELARMLAEAENAMPSVDWRPVFCWIHDHPQLALAIVAELRTLARHATIGQTAAVDSEPSEATL